MRISYVTLKDDLPSISLCVREDRALVQNLLTNETFLAPLSKIKIEESTLYVEREGV